MSIAPYLQKMISRLTEERDALDKLVNELSAEKVALLAELETRKNEIETLKDMLTDATEEREMSEAEAESGRRLLREAACGLGNRNQVAARIWDYLEGWEG